MKESPIRSGLLRFRVGDPIKNYVVATAPGSEGADFAAPLGEGGSGMVFFVNQVLHEDVSINRALKFFVYRDDIAYLSAHKKSGAVSRNDFLAEIVNISSVNHKNVTKVIDAGFLDMEEQKVPFIVTEYIQGPTLKDVIEGKYAAFIETLVDNPHLVLGTLLDIADGLQYLHKSGFAHCDVAPKNIFLNELESFNPIIGDLGIAKDVNRERDTVFVSGSKGYMPIEALEYLNKEIEWNHFLQLHPRWDIYAYAKTGLELLSVLGGTLDSVPWKKSLFSAFTECINGRRYLALEDLIERINFLHPINREVANVPELSVRSAGSRGKLVPVEPLTITKRVRKLIAHPTLMRLARVNQLTTAYQTFPGAVHSRYEHSLGVLETMRRYILALLDQEQFLEHLSSRKIETALICALLWNITRFPFSNILHEIKGSNPKDLGWFSNEAILKETLAIKDSKERGILDLVAELFPMVDTANIRNVLLEKKDLFDNEDRMIYSLLSSSLDTRVIDFVRRDSLHLGITGGDPINIDDLLPHLCIRDHKLAIWLSGVSEAEKIISMRYWLFNRIYWCRPNRVFVSMVRYLFMELLKAYGFLGEFRARMLQYTDRRLLAFLRKQSEKTRNRKIIDVARLLTQEEQELYWVIMEITIFEESRLRSFFSRVDMMSYEEIKEIELDIEGIFAAYGIENCDLKGVLVDLPREPGKSKLGEDILVVIPENGDARGLLDVSGIVKGVNEGFEKHLRKFRVFIHPVLSPRDREERKRIRREIQEYLIGKWG